MCLAQCPLPPRVPNRGLRNEANPRDPVERRSHPLQKQRAHAGRELARGAPIER